jgi:hypothetical protein
MNLRAREGVFPAEGRPGRLNWRVTFRFEEEDAIVVDYRDYH